MLLQLDPLSPTGLSRLEVIQNDVVFGLGGGSSGGGAWGSITGTLSDQTDLQTALDLKLTGPASATDEAIARFDGTTGKLLQSTSNSLLSNGGDLKTGGYLRVGSVIDPANTTAGDMTGVRLAIGDDTAFSSASGSFAKFKGEMTDTSSGAKYGIYSQADMNNGSASTSEVRVLGMSAQIKAGNTNDVGTMIGIFGETRVFGNATTSTLIGGRFFGAVVPSTSDLNGKTISSTNGLDVTGFKISGTPPNAATITTAKGININNNDAPSPITMTSSIGLDIAAQTRGATNNFGIRVAAPSGATNNFAIQLSDTGGTAPGGITFGTDTQLYRSAANSLTIASGDSLGIGSAPTHALTLASGNAFAAYNTADQTTNYERLRMSWVSNNLELFTEAAGSGVARNMRLGDSGGYLDFSPAAASGGAKFTYNRTSNTSGSLFRVVASGLTGGAGVTQYGLRVDPTVNQTSTAAFYAIDVNPTLTAVGSGGGFLLGLRVANSTKMSVASDGLVFMADLTAPSGTPSGGGYLYVESGALKYKGSSGTVTTIANA